jgi:hypothetical protein
LSLWGHEPSIINNYGIKKLTSLSGKPHVIIRTNISKKDCQENEANQFHINPTLGKFQGESCRQGAES